MNKPVSGVKPEIIVATEGPVPEKDDGNAILKVPIRGSMNITQTDGTVKGDFDMGSGYKMFICE